MCAPRSPHLHAYSHGLAFILALLLPLLAFFWGVRKLLTASPLYPGTPVGIVCTSPIAGRIRATLCSLIS